MVAFIILPPKVYGARFNEIIPYFQQKDHEIGDFSKIYERNSFNKKEFCSLILNEGMKKGRKQRWILQRV